MKKTMSIIMVVILICISLCGCKENNRNLAKDETLLSLEMIVYTYEACLYLSDSNTYMLNMLDALYWDEDIETSIEYLDEALKLLVDAEENMKVVISSPNFIEEDLKELQENYKRTIEIMKESSNITDEEEEEFYILLHEGSTSHVYLMKCLQCFANLYSIRKFDSLPDEEAKENLKEDWCEFGFEDTIECPDTIEEKELYLIWANQWTDTEVSQSTIDKIFELRENDNLASKEYNKKWLELVKEICSTNNGDEKYYPRY